EANSSVDEQIVSDILQKTHLWELKDRMLGHLSGGEMQRTMIARAMAQQSPILLLDEPLANLDIAHKFEIMDILKELNQVNQTTIIIILHDFSFAKQYTDQTLLLNRGKVQLFSDSNSVITTNNIQNAFSLSEDYQVDSRGNIIRNNPIN
ncbi:MAG: ABC transporter ATP-binding protein, partial [Bacteroidales bacterium]|nr:ABC transporter ATP-binding protein [Bacteroidales bacterium]